ncbi:MAG TPA: globin family protein [Stellaceae bacterium]|jgi:hemoglobin-like flavoprotein|nr:globin family protein [Stellaceae bacterium]
MSPEQIQLVRSSFATVTPIADQAGMMFYDRLFTIDPSLRPLFKNDVTEQSRALIKMIGVAVGGLDKLHTIVPAVQALGVRHAGYGVTDAHYDTVAAALVWTLGQGLGDDFTPEVEAAWIAAYTLLATTMQTAARGTSA